MSVYAIGDLHLAIGNPEKTMEVFRGWQDYQRRIEENWRALVRPEDTVVLAGDISWAMRLADAGPQAADEGQPRLLVDHPQQDGAFFCGGGFNHPVCPP